MDHLNFDWENAIFWENHWENVIFSDESSIWLYSNSIKMWTRNSEKALYQRPKYSPNFHGWGGVSMLGATPVRVFEGNMTSEQFTDIL